MYRLGRSLLISGALVLVAIAAVQAFVLYWEAPFESQSTDGAAFDSIFDVGERTVDGIDSSPTQGQAYVVLHGYSTGNETLLCTVDMPLPDRTVCPVPPLPVDGPYGLWLYSLDVTDPGGLVFWEAVDFNVTHNGTAISSNVTSPLGASNDTTPPTPSHGATNGSTAREKGDLSFIAALAVFALFLAL